jgi:hypothetical protein
MMLLRYRAYCDLRRQMQDLQQQHGALREARANEQGKLTTLKESVCYTCVNQHMFNSTQLMIEHALRTT